jgi:hypothetical protein
MGGKPPDGKGRPPRTGGLSGADDELRSASVTPLLGHPDRMIEWLQWMTETLDFASFIGAGRAFGLA